MHAFLEHNILTKLLPFVHDFLCQTNTMSKMYVYAMRKRGYTHKVVRLLDSFHYFFGNLILCHNNNPCSNMSKSLYFIQLASVFAIVILDDLHHV